LSPSFARPLPLSLQFSDVLLHTYPPENNIYKFRNEMPLCGMKVGLVGNFPPTSELESWLFGFFMFIMRTGAGLAAM